MKERTKKKEVNQHDIGSKGKEASCLIKFTMQHREQREVNSIHLYETPYSKEILKWLLTHSKGIV